MNKHVAFILITIGSVACGASPARGADVAGPGEGTGCSCQGEGLVVVGRCRMLEESSTRAGITASSEPDAVSAAASAVDFYDLGESFRSFSPTTVEAGAPGQTIVISGATANLGTQASPPVTIAFYASTDTVINSSDYLISDGTMPSIAAGEGVTWQATREFPTTIPAGTYYVGWIVDADNDVWESNEDDNVAYVHSYRLTVTGGGGPGPGPGGDIIPTGPVVPGDRVVVHDKTGNLKPGQSGTVMCTSPRSLLVSWDMWSQGGAGTTGCSDKPLGDYPDGSASWVDPVWDGTFSRHFNATGVLVQGLAYPIHLRTDGGLRYGLTDSYGFNLGDRVRVRGLVPIFAVTIGGETPIIHPILSDAQDPLPRCCDPQACVLRPGDKVVLLNDDGTLPAGASGTVYCCGGGSSVLVSWDLWVGQIQIGPLCAGSPIGSCPADSLRWVPVPNIGKYVDLGCGTIDWYQFPPGPRPITPWYSFRADRTTHGIKEFILGNYLGFPGLDVGDRVQIRGLISAGSAQVEHPIISQCIGPGPGCCDPPYQPGDRVLCLDNNPSGAPDLYMGATGTVVCCDSGNPARPVFVSWDAWSKGTNDDLACDTTPIPYASNSGWWMACADTTFLGGSDLFDEGESYRSFSPQTIQAGEPGQMFEVEASIGNEGISTSGTVYVAVYLSRDTIINESDYYIGRVSMWLMPGASATLWWRANFPTDVPPGTYYVGWIIDPQNDVMETNENNNTAYKEGYQLHVVGAGPGPGAVIDDFEAYDDAFNLIFATWIDGYGYLNPPPGQPGNGSSGRVGNRWPPYAERTIVHAGRQSMPFEYRNDLSPWYSEAQRTYETPQDWSASRGGVLSLWFYGDPANTPEQLYLYLEDSHRRMAPAFHRDPAALRSDRWQQWTMPMSVFADAGVELSQIVRIYLGVGDRNRPVSSGPGTLYFDDIALVE